MLLNINPASGTPIFIQIKEQIKTAIASGVLRQGDKLPSVRQLSGQLTVNPNTISKAYAELEAEGIIKKERGIGMFVFQNAVRDTAASEEVFRENLEELFTQAYHLNIPPSRIERLFREKLDTWENRLNKEEK